MGGWCANLTIPFIAVSRFAIQKGAQLERSQVEFQPEVRELLGHFQIIALEGRVDQRLQPGVDNLPQLDVVLHQEPYFRSKGSVRFARLE